VAITPFKVIQGKRFWYHSKAHIRLPINLPPILHRFQVMADHVKFSLATGGFTLMLSLGWFPANIVISDTQLKTNLFGLHFTRRMCPCIFNHFYVMGPQKLYRVRRNNANYTTITPFKVIQGHRFWYNRKFIYGTSY